MENSEIIRVLIVDGNVESREKTRSLLKMEKGMEIVGVSRGGREAIDLAQETEPDVVVLDASLPDMDEIEVTEAICRRVPFTQVVILAVQVDPNYMRRAMLAGARDFIVKPPMTDELRSAVYRAGGLAHERRDNSLRVLPQSATEAQHARPLASTTLGKIIQLYSPKGGSGCTTLATNLAIALHSEKTHSILVDANLQYGDVAVFFNEVAYHSVLDLAPRVNDLDPEVIASVTVNHQKSGVDIIVAPNRPEMADKVSGEEFYKVLQYLRRLYGYIIVDTPTELNDVTLSVLDAADLVVLVTTQEISSIKNSRLFLSVTDGLHFDRQRILFVMNRFDKKVAISPEKVTENLKQEIVSVIPADEACAVRAANQGIPFVLESKTYPLTKSIFNLAEIIRSRLGSLETGDATQMKVFRTEA
ncbi:MAG: response regulator [Chloroflexi bacterium]|nr:response regulator [Chloroflexota bacterium]